MTDPDWRELLRVASQMRREGRVDEAIEAYQRLLAVNPQLPDSWYNLAWLQRQARQYEQALASYQRALDLKVAQPEEVHLNRAVIYSDHLHRPGDAAGELTAALERNPRYVPALLNLGNLREDLGDRASAIGAYTRALDVSPGNRLALARLAGVSHAPELDERLAGRLRSAIEDPNSPESEKADLGFALAGLLDAAARYAEAFEAARAANLASRNATGARYDRAAAELFVDRLIAAFGKHVAARDAGPSPLFICGMFRSGSTLIEQILASHSRINGGGELDLIPALVARIAGYPEAAAGADETMISEWREFYLTGVEPIAREGAIGTDKRPDNFLHVGLIKTIFPSAKIVHTRRHRLDNLLSLYFLHLDPGMSYALDLHDSAHWYAQHERLMEHWKALYPGDIFEVDYDELVRSPEPLLKRLIAFLELEWEETVLDFTARERPVKTASVWQVRQPLHARSSGRWKNYSALMTNELGHADG